MPQNTQDHILARREAVWRLKLSGRWSMVTAEALAARWGVGLRQIQKDLEVAQRKRIEALQGPRLEQMRAEIAFGLKEVQRRAKAASNCRTCRGIGYIELVELEPGTWSECDTCMGSGQRRDADSRMLMVERQALMDLAQLYGLTKVPPEVAVQIGTEDMDLSQLLETISEAEGVLKRLAPTTS
ncbi:MAG: hypothetical protein AAFR76_01540 [Planctomycetota bacterium]